MQPNDNPQRRADCPKLDELAVFFLGLLSNDELEVIQRHLDSCLFCRLQLKALHYANELENNNPLTGPFTVANGPRPFGLHETPQKAVATLGANSPSAIEHPHPPGSAWPLPRLLGQYLLVEKLGQGGMGTVYKAQHTRLKRWVAVKTMRPDRLHHPRTVARFYREMEAVGKLDHPHLVRALDANEVEGCHFLVMEFLEGIDLAHVVDRQGPLPVPVACEMIRQAALGLQFVHENGLIHRDVKPSNLMLTTQGLVKVLDLGLARLRPDLKASDERLTDSSQVIGTADYMAPEQANNNRDADIRADIYSLGCALYKLLAGKAPFSGPEYSSFFKKVIAHTDKPVPPIRNVRPDIPAALVVVLDRMLAKTPADRFALPEDSARALMPFTSGTDLKGLAAKVLSAPSRDENLTVHHLSPPPTKSKDQRPGLKMGRSQWLVLAAGVFLLLFGLGVVLTNHQAPRVFLPGGEYDLLDRKPVELHWPQSPENSRWDYDEKTRKLWVHCKDRGMIELAELPGYGFDLELTISQTPWVGGVGVFFRSRPEEAGGAHICSDLLSLELFNQKKNTEPALLKRGVMRCYATPPRASADWQKSDTMVRPSSGEHRLRITLTSEGLKQVLWDSAPVAPKVCDLPDDAIPLQGTAGGVGVFVENSNAVFHSVRLHIHPSPREDP